MREEKTQRLRDPEKKKSFLFSLCLCVSVLNLRNLRFLLFASAITFLIASTNLLPQVVPAGSNLKTIYIIPLLGHLDLGFTATQREIRQKWPRIYREGLEFLERHPDATLTSDSLLPVEWFREDATPDEWRQFRELVKSGRWELTAGWAHMNTAMMSEAEIRRFFLPSRKWEEELGVPIRIWHHADVPGLSWNMAEAATDAKLEMIVVGANELGGLSPLPDLPRLFNWEAPDGEKIPLSLHGGSGYLEGALDLKIHIEDGLEERLKNFEYYLKNRGYPIDITMVLFSSGDNRGPEIFEQLLRTINQWNSKGKTLKLQISTLSNFKEIIKDKIATLPARKGDWPASWEALVRRAPRGENLVREAQRNLVTGEALSVANGQPDRAVIDRAWRNVLSHDEHSGTGVWPKMLTHLQAVEQNRTEYGYASDAYEYSRELVAEGFETLNSRIGGIAGGNFMVFNPNSHPKNLAVIYPEMRFIHVDPFRGVGFRIKKFNNRDETAIKTDGTPFWQLEPSKPIVSSVFLEQSYWSSTRFDGLLLTRFIFHLPVWSNNENQCYLFAVRNARSEFNLIGLMRGGLLIRKERELNGRNLYHYPFEGIWLEDKKNESLLVTSMDGAPFHIEDGRQLSSLLLIKEPVAMLRDGAMADIDPEPGAPSQVSCRYIIKQSIHIRNEEDAISYLDSAANPMVSVRFEAGARQAAGPLPASGIFIETDDPRAWITEIKWADFGEGVIVVMRNVSDKRITAQLRSDFWRFISAVQVDGLQRDVTDGNLYCTDEKNRRRTCNGAEGFNPHLILDPKQVIEIRLHIAFKTVGSGR